MKVIRILPLLLTTLLVCSCEKMLTVDSTRYLKAEKNLLDSPNDTLYSIAGILTKFQELGDRYVILGDLRADLMDVTEHADQNLCDLSDLIFNEDNPWIDITPYYRVINHCNYFINQVDTSIVAGGKKVMMGEFAAAKAIRAWVYYQMALNYGKAYYFTKPILTIDEANKEYPMLERDDILTLVYEDLQDVKDVAMPNYGQLGDYSSTILFPSVNYLLGELSLWKNDYLNAASYFHKEINSQVWLVSPEFQSTYRISGRYVEGDYTTFIVRALWGDQFYSVAAKSGNNWVIPYFYSSSYGEFNNSNLFDMTEVSYTIAPSQRARDLFETQVYSDLSFHEQEGIRYNLTIKGDLRGKNGSYRECGSEVQLESSSVVTDANYDQYEINKAPVGSAYISIHEQNRVILQRGVHAYLRYAEAVNYLGFPNMALAVVNDGLNHDLMLDSVYVNMNKIDNSSNPDILKWDDTRFNSNVGTRTRGQGPSSKVVFPPELKTLQDSIDFVETILVEECALECPFLGVRYHDLMRFSHHRHPTILAENIAKKKPELYDMLLDEANWYLPTFE